MAPQTPNVAQIRVWPQTWPTMGLSGHPDTSPSSTYVHYTPINKTTYTNFLFFFFNFYFLFFYYYFRVYSYAFAFCRLLAPPLPVQLRPTAVKNVPLFLSFLFRPRTRLYLKREASYGPPNMGTPHSTGLKPELCVSEAFFLHQTFPFANLKVKSTLHKFNFDTCYRPFFLLFQMRHRN